MHLVTGIKMLLTPLNVSINIFFIWHIPAPVQPRRFSPKSSIWTHLPRQSCVRSLFYFFFLALQQWRGKSVWRASTRDLSLQCWHGFPGLCEKTHALDKEGRASFLLKQQIGQWNLKTSQLGTKLCFKRVYSCRLATARTMTSMAPRCWCTLQATTALWT